MIFCRLFVRLLLLAACASAPLALAAGNYNTTDITVGTTVITIPAPKEFALLPPEAQPYFEWITRFITPNSEQFAVFLSEADVANAKQGGMPDSRGRMFRVQTTKQLIPISFTRAQFTKFKSALKAQNESMLKEVEAEMPGVVGKIIKEISDSHKVNLGDFGLSTVQMMQFRLMMTRSEKSHILCCSPSK